MAELRVCTATKHPFDKRIAHIKFLMDGDVGGVERPRVRLVECGTNTDFIKNRYICLSFSYTLLARSTMRIPNAATIIVGRLLFRSTRARYADRKNTAVPKVQIISYFHHVNSDDSNFSCAISPSNLSSFLLERERERKTSLIIYFENIINFPARLLVLMIF